MSGFTVEQSAVEQIEIERSHSSERRHHLEEEGKPIISGDAGEELIGRAGRRDCLGGQERVGRDKFGVGTDGSGSDHVHGAGGDSRA